MPDTMLVRKRDGNTQSWDKKKVERAIFSAFNDIDPENIPNVSALSEEVEKTIKTIAADGQCDIEQVQDAVEKVLMKKRPEVAQIYIRYRARRAEIRDHRKDPDPSAISDYIHAGKYAADKGREPYEKSVERNKRMHLKKYKDAINEHPELKDAIDKAYEFMKQRKLLPSMRSLQFGGRAIERNNLRSFNCAYTHINRSRVFAEILFSLLSGTGMGFSVQYHHIEQLPDLKTINPKQVKHYIVPDTIEGWSEALNELMKSYFYTGEYIEFSFHLIRPEGASLSTGGVAPGHLGLKKSLEEIRKILNQAQGRKLRPVEAYDIICHSAEAVLSGGIRRSALACLFSADDGEMLYCKAHGNFRPAFGGDPGVNPHRQYSNNSAVLLRSETKRDTFDRLMKVNREWGEPGFYFTDSLEFGANPCVTADTVIATSDGPKKVSDLIGVQFNALVNGQSYKTTEHGFIQTGVKPVMKITTREGYSIRLTSNHKVLTPNNGWVEAGDLEIGSEIVLHDHYKAKSWDGIGSFEDGWLLGNHFGDGTYTNTYATVDYWGEHKGYMRSLAVDRIKQAELTTYQPMEKRSDRVSIKERVGSVKLLKLTQDYGIDKKNQSDSVLFTSSAFHIGFLRGWFDADGSVQGDVKKGRSVRLASVSREQLRIAQQMLLNLGIKSVVYEGRLPEGYRKLPDGHGGLKDYYCKESHELVISRDCMIRFRDTIGFDEPDRASKLDEIIASSSRTPYKTKFEARVSNISYDSVEPVYDCCVPGPHAFDANGIYVHNCYEISLYPTLEKYSPATTKQIKNTDTTHLFDPDTLKLDPDATDAVVSKAYGSKSGIDLCNLTEINAARIETADEFVEVAESAALLGTLQAGYTDFKYLGPITERIVRKSALLGVSITGIMDNPEVALNPVALKMASKAAIKENERIAKMIGINAASRVTTIKPSGTASLALGGIGSGIHYHHARRYFRRVVANPNEAVAQHFKTVNPHMVEVKPNGDWCLVFPIKAPDDAKTVKEEPAAEFVEHIFTVYENWVKPGSATKRNKLPLTHNVSATVALREEERDDIVEMVWENRDRITAMSFLPIMGDKIYPFAPREEVVTENDEAKWNYLIANYKKVDYSVMEGEEMNRTLDVACGGGACEI